MGKAIRLDKFLVEMNRGSRSQVKEAAKRGSILVNGVAVKKTDQKIDPDTDRVVFDGMPVSYRTFEYFMLNKPQGVVSATEDNLHKTVLDLLDGDNRSDLFPVGRLDIDTEGLLILTNDGDLAHRLLAPKKHVDKQYYAKVAGVLPENAVEQMALGLTLADGTVVSPAKLEILAENVAGQEKNVAEQAENMPGQAETGNYGEGPLTEALLTIQEGKFHQVKRMFGALGCRVVFLKRLSMGPLKLDGSLKPGEYRRLTDEEVKALGEDNRKESE